ncbi:pyridoxal 5'-phosphate synthase glutaminase subunit PdxT [Chloroflexota bacterium]
MRIGVLALQGAFVEHINILRQMKVEVIPVRLPAELISLDGLIIPGGESTSISSLMLSYHLTDTIKSLANTGMPVLGICAGMILLGSTVVDSSMEPLGLMDVRIRRNAFGRQKASFEVELSIPDLGEEPFRCVFIRAPVIEQVGSNVVILARLADGSCVTAREGNLVASAFHPELTNDLRFHQYFLDIIAGHGG